MSRPSQAQETRVIHVLGISGGKDSAALAVYMRRRQSDMIYYFCDTGEELQETYDYLAVLETYLGKPIKRLNPDRPFRHYLDYMYKGYLPSPHMRWCTRMLKIKPFEAWIDTEYPGCQVQSYIAIRADEDREGYISHKPYIQAVYPFKKAGIDKAEVYRIIEEAGIGLPKYYEWRTRSGCYFCFFQRKAEWIGLKERHPELYEKAKTYEKTVTDPVTGKQTAYTWSQGESLIQIEQPDRAAEIKALHERALQVEMQRRKHERLRELFQSEESNDGGPTADQAEALKVVLDDEDDTPPCTICDL
jgi:3'-phosphoadenosine 5'-phosphosulfate sulfotransferase (PAPS reductase)/FAD synthetase